MASPWSNPSSPAEDKAELKRKLEAGHFDAPPPLEALPPERSCFRVNPKLFLRFLREDGARRISADVNLYKGYRVVRDADQKEMARWVRNEEDGA